jgi:hypothetical protein
MDQSISRNLTGWCQAIVTRYTWWRDYHIFLKMAYRTAVMNEDFWKFECENLIAKMDKKDRNYWQDLTKKH